VVKRLALRYGERAIVDVLFTRCTPDQIEPLRKEDDSELRAYDEWTVDRYADVETESATRT
jgi:hypothetical protein